MEDVAVTAGHTPQGATIFVTVQVPGVLDARFTCPVDVLTNTSPPVDENVPADPLPVNVGDGLVAFLQ